MAKQSMIQREIKRENLIAKYETKREVLKQQLNSSDGYKVKLQIYKKTKSDVLCYTDQYF